MKIDFLVSSLVAGGAERVLILLANYFNERGHDVTIITFNEPEIFSANNTVKRVRLHGGKLKNHTLRYTINLLKYYLKNENRPDIMMPFMTQTNFIGIVVGKIYNIKVVSAEHNNHLRKTDFIGTLTRKYLYRISDALTVLSSFDEKYYKNQGVNVFVMPNPLTFKVIKHINKNRKKLILAIGDLNRYHIKGFDNLIPTVAPVLKKNTDWKLKFVGGGEKGINFLRNLARHYQIENQVIFEGYSDRVGEIMKESQIYVMSSRSEGLPMVLIEALSMGMACISFDCITGPSDIINNNVNGLLVEDQNLNAMSKGIDTLINNKKLRERLIFEGVNSLDKFRIDVIYKNYFDIFESILKKR